MQRMTKYEIVTITLMIVALLGMGASRLSNALLLEEVFKFAACFLFILALVLIFIRAGRSYSAQKRAREEIYQVLYTLHGNDKSMEHQARKTRDHLEASKMRTLEEMEGISRDLESLTELFLRQWRMRSTDGSVALSVPKVADTSSVPKSAQVTNRDILAEYSKRLRSWASHAEAVGLMNRSSFIRDVFAYAATFETFDARQLYLQISRGYADEIAFRYEWLYRLGRFLFFQGEGTEDRDFALFCLGTSAYKLRLRSHRRDALRFQIELLAERGEFVEARRVFQESQSLLGDEFHYLWVDLQNPFVGDGGMTQEKWLEMFNTPFKSKNLNGIRLAAEISGQPFDRLESSPSVGPLPKGPLVTVIMTSYDPDERALELAVNSILQQSWYQLELIVVDDATPGGAPTFLDSVAQKDSRVKIIKLRENRGTYHARNVGLKAARGDFVTGQDSDDWSHPDRIYRQVRTLQKDNSAVGVAVTAIRSDDNLFRVLRGIAPHRLCEVSLMFPREVALAMGGYLESRKGADSEFRMRLELYSEQPVTHLDEPLYLTRLSSGSLSRSDFKRGWAHQNRRAFSGFIRHWHRTASGHQLSLTEEKSRSTAIPPKFRSVSISQRKFDVVYVSDWRFEDSTMRASLAEIKTLQQQGKTVGIIQVAGLFPNHTKISELSSNIQHLINDEKLTLVIPDEDAIIQSLVIRSAESLQFSPIDGFVGTVHNVTIIADKAPSGWDGSSPIYHPYQCDEAAATIFGVEPVWATFDPAVHRLLYSYGHLKIHPQVLPPVLPPLNEPVSPNHQKEPGRTIIGRPVRNLEAWWPEEHAVANLIWPQESDSLEIRLLGDGSCYLRKYGLELYPANWASYDITEVDSDTFYESLDYFIYYPDENWPQEFSYDALVASINGATVVLPPQFGPMHHHNAHIVEAVQVPEVLSGIRPKEAGSSTLEPFWGNYAEAVAQSRMDFLKEFDTVVATSSNYGSCAEEKSSRSD